MLKTLSVILFILFAFSLPVKAQFKESKQRQKMWHKSKKRRKNREAFNPYLDKKQKDKPSSVAAKEEKEGTRKMRRNYKRQIKKERKKRGIKTGKG